MRLFDRLRQRVLKIQSSLIHSYPSRSSIVLASSPISKIADTLAELWEYDSATARTLEQSICELLETIEKS